MAGLALVFGLATGFVLLYRLVYILLLVLATSFLWSRLTLWRVEASADRRTLRTQVGGYAEERITVRNPTWLTKLWLEVEDLTDLPGHQNVELVTLPARSFRSWLVRTLCSRRGLYTIGPLRVRSGDLFGLFQGQRILPGAHQLLVSPRVVPLPSFRVPGSDLVGDGAVKLRSSAVTPHASGIREYVYGDSAHRIHWPSTLRLGKPMSKEFDIGFTTDTWLFLDFQASVQAETGEDSTDEVMVTIAASVASRLLRAQLPMGVVAHGGERYFLPTQRGVAYLDRILEVLARARADGSVPLEQALAFEERLFNRYSTLIILTPSAHEEWLAAVRVLRQRHIRLAVVLVDALSFGGRESPEPLLKKLGAHGVPSTLVRRGDDLDVALRGIQASVPQGVVSGRERLAWM